MLAKYIIVTLLAAFAIAAPRPVEQSVDSYESALTVEDQTPKSVGASLLFIRNSTN
jgi:hypothetical protein